MAPPERDPSGGADEAPSRAPVIVAGAFGGDAVELSREFAAALADGLGLPVVLARVGPEGLDRLRALLQVEGAAETLEIQPRPPVSALPMAGAPFVWRDDGRPDWGAMWTSFCELALFGGPAHRGEDSALAAPDPVADTAPIPTAADAAMLAEVRRGIWETTGLFAEPALPGWIAVTCESRKMAAWLCAAIILENVEARCEEERLLLPAEPGLTLTDQVKSLITVVAKTHHYWQAHVTGTGQDVTPGAPPGRSRTGAGPPPP
jgi:hypothetical protein